MTNETDLREISAQIELVKQLLGPETFDLDKTLIELETKKKLLMTFKPRSYATILKGLESGELIHPGEWVKPPEEKKVIKKPEKPKIDKKALALEKETIELIVDKELLEKNKLIEDKKAELAKLLGE